MTSGRTDWGVRNLVDATGVTFRYAEVEITTGELLALFTTPKQLVAAPGAAYVLEFVSLLVAYDFLSAAYTIGAAGDLQVKYTNGTGAAASTTLAATGFLDGGADTLRYMDRLESSITPVANAALVLTLATANPTLGDSPLHCKVTYKVYATGL